MRLKGGADYPAAFANSSMGAKEFVVLMAALMATNALSIDIMLPVLPEIADALHISAENDRQWVITAYLLGFGGAQLFYGPLADRFGRKPVVIVALIIYVLCSVLAAFASSLHEMMFARFLQGVGAAGTRVLTITIVRDCYSGRKMARVMSLVFIVFLSAPVLAPSLGQAIAAFAPWPSIFGLLAVFGVVTALWVGRRMPETLHPEDRQALSFAGIHHGVRLVVSSRQALGYMFASLAMLSALFSFVTSAQQVFTVALHAQDLFVIIFAIAAGSMAVASLLNSRIVERLGMRRVSQTALLGFIGFAVIHGVVAVSGHDGVWTFAALQSGMMFCFGLVGANFNSLAMEPLGDAAGTGSSILGFVTTTGGALIGFAVGQQFDGTAIPLTLGFIASGVAALLIVLVTEMGRLFRAVDTGEA
ncbi:multidrug effflux MFS transporter [Methyloligella sp. 2.7D]|uniref:multidrug effflux MFS transporter n=1 Tax=unclassified Methyloligella TaxID=2625955 RepID=UPI001FF07141|nr:multidrug effflux MFS transporter [Methyloligella sp. GL2]